mmetsp:Transcript_71709/g.160560  ORF Transcript_71709/g.160560 Transcript_71709/m.160560 type:complete len:95 (+) Transcript_71709:64-348(+)
MAPTRKASKHAGKVKASLDDVFSNTCKVKKTADAKVLVSVAEITTGELRLPPTCRALAESKQGRRPRAALAKANEEPVKVVIKAIPGAALGRVI